MSSKRYDSKPAGSSNLALTAVALQDHWSRTISLGPKFGPKRVGVGPATRAKQKKEVKSVIDTGFNKGRKLPPIKKEKEEVEYVLDKQLPPLTLAQKFGLVHAPKPLLSESEWSEIKEKSNKRADSGEPCVICKEDFGTQDQVLLSCTHVFHRACLQAFERFSGRKTCPMCRQEQYQTRVIHEGARVHRYKSAIKIQSTWRGYVVRSWYRNLRATVPPKDPMLRKKFYEEKMSSIIDRMVKSLDMNMAAFMQEIDASIQHSRDIFSQWDACHMTITDQEWEAIQLKAVQRGSENCPICLTELQHPTEPSSNNEDLNHQHRDKAMSPPLSRNPNNSSIESKQTSATPTTTTTTTTHKDKLYARKLKDQKLFAKISIPSDFQISDLNSNNEPDSSSASGGQNQNHQTQLWSLKDPEDASSHVKSDCSSNHKVRSTVLLSCSHVFHTTCLNTLEEMAMLDIKNTCPICRSHYQKKIIVF